MKKYNTTFYKKQKDGSLQSAEEIVPLVVRLIQPKSVIDIGCGVGTWLSVFMKYDIEEALGIDGDYVDKKMLQIPKENFLSFDLEKPFIIEKQFDLVVSLEVAEHLPNKCAESFIKCLVNLGPVILFSAAIPFQGGINHINEQWPEYWVKLFKDNGYEVIDCIRKEIWNNENVEWWYAQNILIFARYDFVINHTLLKQMFSNTNNIPLSIVHPKRYLQSVRSIQAINKLKIYNLLK